MDKDLNNVLWQLEEILSNFIFESPFNTHQFNQYVKENKDKIADTMILISLIKKYLEKYYN
jgi:hypothetical protein